MKPGDKPRDLLLQVQKIPSHFGPLLIVTFEQSRSPKGVAVASLQIASHPFLEDVPEEVTLRRVLHQLRTQTIEAHGVDVMPHQDDWYWMDPWPPEAGPIHRRTVLKYGDGVTNLREHAAFTLRMAEARGIKIKVPIRPPHGFEREIQLPTTNISLEALRKTRGY